MWASRRLPGKARDARIPGNFVSDEQRRWAGCIGGQNGRSIVTRVLRVVGVIVGVSLGLAPGAGAQVHRDSRFMVSGNVGLQATINTRADRVDFEVYEETGHFVATQELPRAAVYDVGVDGRIWKGFGLGGSVSYTNIVTTATLDAEVPHPFFFDFPRSTTGESGNLAHREWVLNLRAQYWIPLGERFRLTVFAGPSLYDARQDLVTGITATEVGFPFDDVDISASGTEAVTITAVGFNAGLDLSYFGLRQIGIFESFETLDRVGLAVMLRFNRAAPAIGLEGQFQPALELGGTQIGGGLRFVF